MRAFEEIIRALYSAMLVDLPVNEGERRPYPDELVVDSFSQTWGSTALGFGGIGGAAMTNAQTVVVRSGKSACVYFGGRHAYTITHYNTAFVDDIDAKHMAKVSACGKYEQQ